MALPILDGNQSATTLSTILTGGAHIPAHTVVSLGSQAITDITSAVSGISVSIGGTQTTTFGAVTGSVSVLNFPATQTIAGTVTAGNIPVITDGDGDPINNGIALAFYDNVSDVRRVAGESWPLPVSLNSAGLPAISGTVTASVFNATISYVSAVLDGDGNTFGIDRDFPVSGTVTVGNSITVSNFPASQTVTGTVELGPTSLNALESITVTMGQVVVTGGLTDAQLRASAVTIGGTVTASGIAEDKISGGFYPIPLADSAEAVIVDVRDGSISVGNSVTIGSLPTLTPQLPRVTFIDGSGTVTTANTAVTVFASSTTRSYLLVQVTTGSAFVNVGATATTVNGISLSAGQGYAWETTIPQGIVSLISTSTSSQYVAKQA